MNLQEKVDNMVSHRQPKQGDKVDEPDINKADGVSMDMTLSKLSCLREDVDNVET